MDVIREVRTVTDQRVIIDLPDHFRNTEVEILVLPLNRFPPKKEIEKDTVEGDIIESLHEVKKMRAGEQAEKTAQELLSEL